MGSFDADKHPCFASVCRKRRGTAWDNNFWLDLDYLQVAQAALNVQNYFTAVLFAEIWCDVQRY